MRSSSALRPLIIQILQGTLRMTEFFPIFVLGLSTEGFYLTLLRIMYLFLKHVNDNVYSQVRMLKFSCARNLQSLGSHIIFLSVCEV